MDANAVIAAIRFGHGRRPSDAAPSDPAAWLEAQVAATPPGPVLPADLPVTLRAVFLAQAEDNVTARAGMGRPNAQRIGTTETAAALALLIDSPSPLYERLVTFWTNHFTVARGKVGALIGTYVRDAIRPHVTGRFEDMLLAVVRHPAMLLYLDNQNSIGPDSPAGQRARRGLNENLAREILELHTVTPAARYTQADVTSFAKVLTGWSYAGTREPYGFEFRDRAHEPGDKTVLGRTWPEGEQGGVQALTWLARHESTHRHLATKLVRHFVADEPPPEAVRTVFATLRDSRGDLGAAARALIRLPAAWSPPLTKLRTPQDYVPAVLRAVEASGEQADRMAVGTLGYLGQPLWGARAPIGWPDLAADWAVPETMLRRVEWANGISARGAGRDAAELAEATLGPLARPETLRAAARAGSAREALTIVLTSPEFNRR